MAIYHCSVRTFSRTQGHSAVAAAAYRAGSIIQDERTGIIHRYHNRSGVADTFILAPNNAPEKFQSRAFLWNVAEASENRKNSRVAREVILALPHELSDKARAELSRDMGLYLIERYRVAVDVAIHSPCGDDPRNHHAHLLFTTREVTKDGLGAKTRILDDKITGPQEVEIIREVWETLANDALARAGFADTKIDRRTLEAQGVDRIPQTHEGKASKNTAAYQSLLAKDFDKADKADEEDGEEDGSGEKTSSSSSSSGGGGTALQSKKRTDDKGRIIDYPKLDKEQIRSAFNAEIKAINKQRAAFGDKPLKEQIAQLDRLMERLDKRVEKLRQLESKTSLKAAIKDTIKTVVKFAAALVTHREQAKAVRVFTAQEKHARKERQITRYGREYRQGLHAQIKDMKHNMALVEAKKEDFRRYKSFVDTIDKEIKKHTSITTTYKKEPDQPKRQTTEKEVNLKLHLKAEMIRAQIPKEFKPKSSVKSPRQTLTTSTAVNRILQTKSEPIKIDKAVFKTPEAKIEVKLDQPVKEVAPPVKIEFKRTIEAKPTPKAQAEYKQPMPVKIKALEKAIAERQTAKAETAKPEDRKNWFTPASEKTKPLQKMIETKIKEQRQVTVKTETKTETQSKFTKAQERPVKTATYSEVREKVRAEAEVKRAKVPPEYRAKPYDEKAETQKPKNKTAEPPKTEAKSTFSNAVSAENVPKVSKPKMSAQFNTKSGFNEEAGQSEPEQRQSESPEVEI